MQTAIYVLVSSKPTCFLIKILTFLKLENTISFHKEEIMWKTIQQKHTIIIKQSMTFFPLQGF